MYNTHNETAAKNIKITVVSDLFSVTKGSNSFFVQKIAPGESEELVINLKASAAAMTGSYPINIEMEYEYDGMPASEANAGGISANQSVTVVFGMDGSVMEGFDSGQMPQGGGMPEGFEPRQMPQGGGMPEGFEPGQMPQGGNR